MIRTRILAAPVRFALLLAVCALAMRTLVPAGFMLAPGGGVPRLMLCDGMAPASHGMPMAMPVGSAGHGHHDGHSAPDQPCPFSAAAFAADLAATIAAPAPIVSPGPTTVVPTLTLRPGAGLAAPPPWQTGPPAIA